MNTEAKKAISDRFKIACKREGLNYSEAARLIGIESAYGCKIINEKLWHQIPKRIFEAARDWTNSGETLRRYSAKHNNNEKPENLSNNDKTNNDKLKPGWEQIGELDMSKIIPEEDPLPESSIPDAMTSQILHQKLPYCCPVCGGNGLVANGFYTQASGHWSSSDATPEMCRSCNGTGIVWG